MSDVTDAPAILQRLQARDPSLWPAGNVSANRLGWMDIARSIEREARELRKWADTIDQEVIVLIGMGGSSLGTLVFGSIAESFGTSNGRRLVVCDTTDPQTISATPFEDAFIVVASKSGTTLKPNVLFAHARTRVSDPNRFAIVTDPGTPLFTYANEYGANRVFANQADIGGRYSVLSYFGLVPAALLGYDIADLCDAALSIDQLEAVELGLAMGNAARAGRDKTTIVVEEAHRSFGLWVEQLIAESTGKRGTGIVPVPTSDHEVGNDRHLVKVTLKNPVQLAAEFQRFETAVAVAGHVLEIDPFDEPNVAESKANTNRVLGQLPLPSVPESEPSALGEFLKAQLHEGDYVSIQAYLPFGIDDKLESLRHSIRDTHHGMAVTAGYGPRFLHSTGQLHKGGPPSVVALQLVQRRERPHLDVPGEKYDFATLIEAQAIGDYESLLSHQRRVLRIRLDDLDELVL